MFFKFKLSNNFPLFLNNKNMFYIFGTLAGFWFLNFFIINLNFYQFFIEIGLKDHIQNGLFIGIIVSFGLGTIMAILPLFLTKKVIYIDKIAGFECGFEPFDEARSEFYVKFYHVAALFLLFEIELLLLFPFAIVYLNSLTFLIKKLMFWSFLFFLICIFLSLFLEWNKNILDWE